jgi:8-oxo-dGTP pyrophosphatase MutT (NUDIX family)
VRHDMVRVTAQDEARLHRQVCQIMRTWPAPDTRQESLRVQFLEHLSTHANAVVRDCRAGHITASALIVDPAAERVLLTLHPGVGRWLQTGGHMERADASPEAAALREAHEESGLPRLELIPSPLLLDRHEVPCKASDGERSQLEHFDIQWLVIAAPNSTPVRSSESTDLRWFPWTDLPRGAQGADASVMALVKAARAHLSQ